jgi:transposase
MATKRRKNTQKSGGARAARSFWFPVAQPEQLVVRRQAFQAALHAWYRVHHRKLPWRDAPSLYKTVVSEFMLQQTQVATVLPYFERWLRELPDFAALAAAPEARVMKLWEGLGYYSRARNLHKLAQAYVVRPGQLRAHRPSGASCPASAPTRPPQSRAFPSANPPPWWTATSSASSPASAAKAGSSATAPRR